MDSQGNRTGRKARTVKESEERKRAEGKGMKREAAITVSVVFPETEEGMRELRRRLTAFKSNIVGMAVDRLDMPLEGKRAVLDYICDNHIDIFQLGRGKTD